MIQKLAVLSDLQWVDAEPQNCVSFLSGTENFYVEIEQEVDTEAEIESAEKDLKYYQGFVISVEKKLGNERFVGNAPSQVVENERNKLQDGLEKIKILEETLRKLRGN